MPRALVLTHHLANFAGSEIVAVEAAEELKRRGFEVTLHCHYLGDPLAGELESAGFQASDSETYPDVFGFDLVWSQHCVLASALAAHPVPERWKTRFVSVHLSPHEPFEVSGLPLGRALGAKLVANSPETADRLAALGVERGSVAITHNACPSRFWSEQAAPKGGLSRLLVVSNHVPPEVLEGCRFLQDAGIGVTFLGVNGEYRRLTPSDLQGADAVVTIGKTVQAAIFAGTPVYCYDGFGGPGWLSETNFERAEAFNFSGRCCGLKKTARELAEELRSGHATAAEFTLRLRESRRDRYSLECRMDEILSSAPVRSSLSPAEREELKTALERESLLGFLLRREYRNHQRFRDRWKAAEKRAGQAEQRAAKAESHASLRARELEAMRGSLSWRITAPLRRILHWVRLLAMRARHARPNA